MCQAATSAGLKDHAGRSLATEYCFAAEGCAGFDPHEGSPMKLVSKTSTKPDPAGRSEKLTLVAPTLKTTAALRDAARDCKACDLWKTGTQTVFGEGSSKAQIMFVGEQPGDQEDVAGHPFVGPAGRLLDRALTEAGIDRSQVYVTNAVKHFKWKPAGKRRLHAKPSAREIAACRPWLQAELTLIAPLLVVALGATAAQALM